MTRMQCRSLRAWMLMTFRYRLQRGQALACSAASVKFVGSKGPICCVCVHGHLGGSAGHVLALSNLKRQHEAKSLFENMVNPLSPGSAVSGLLKRESRTSFGTRQIPSTAARQRAAVTRRLMSCFLVGNRNARWHVQEIAKQRAPRVFPKPKSSPNVSFWWPVGG